VAGDEIRTSAATATLVLNDGSLFQIAARSTVRVEEVAGKQTVRVVEGNLGVAKTSATTAIASKKGIVAAETGILQADAAAVVSGSSAAGSDLVRFELPAPSRRR
jgi:ferric-dicitrate binding protein FerR (iron transport regulator)